MPDAPAPFRIAFDNARDPYTARNALGIMGSGGGFITSVTAPLAVTGGNLTVDLSGQQPLDADLTAIAALTGTNVIYYRSAANTWTAVTIGTGLSFTGGTLANTVAAGGNVSNSGTPTSGQYAKWVTATTIQGVAPATVLSDIGAQPAGSYATSTDFPAGAWTTWSPTISAASGTITTSTVSNARFTRMGKTVVAFFHVGVTAAGTGAGFLQVSLPVTCAASGGGTVMARELAVYGGALIGSIFGGGTVMSIIRYDGATPVVSGYAIHGIAVYEGA